MTSEIPFDVYVRCFNEELTAEGWDPSTEEVIRLYWKQGTDPNLAAQDLIAENDEFQ